MTGEQSGPLRGYRVLDLTDEKGALCGKMFADLGADVIKIEPPEGCSTRRIPPFLDGRPGPDRSLYHCAYAAGKRSLTLDLEQEDGRRLFARLAETADFVVESFPLGYLDGLGIGYESLARANPRLILASITPFGDRGPAAGWKAADIVSWAAGGMMFLMGRPGQPPLEVSLPQAGLQAGAEAAVTCMLAHTERQRSGRGQRIVVDMQACVAWSLMNASSFPVLHGDIPRRSGTMEGSNDVARQKVFRCANGFVSAYLSGSEPFLRTSREIVRWMDECGACPDWLKEVDFSAWVTDVFTTESTLELMKVVRACEAELEIFFQRFTRQEIYAVALERTLLIAPVATVEDIAADRQLAARDFFHRVEYPAVQRELTVVGPFAKFSATPMPASRPSPSLGQHNEEILVGELELDPSDLQHLYAQRVL